jgi:hypothetical protein
LKNPRGKQKVYGKKFKKRAKIMPKKLKKELIKA